MRNDKQISYLIRFKTLDTDFPDKDEEIFKQRLSAYLKDTIPMDDLEITKYDRTPISLAKETYSEKVPDLGKESTNSSTFNYVLEKAYKVAGQSDTDSQYDLPYHVADPIAAEIEYMKALVGKFKCGKINAGEFTTNLIDHFMLSLNILKCTADGGRVLSGYTNFEFDERYEYYVTRGLPRLNLDTMKQVTKIKIVLRRTSWSRVLHPFDSQTMTFCIHANAPAKYKKGIWRHSGKPISYVEHTNCPNNAGKKDYGNDIITTFIRIIQNQSGDYCDGTMTFY